jgi:hypothetical protein
MLMLDSNDLLRIGAAAGISNHIDELAPDLLLAQRDPQHPDRPPLHSVAIWTALLENGATDRVEQSCRRLDLALAKLQNVLPCSGLLILPSDGHNTGDALSVDEYRNLHVVRLAMPLQNHEKTFSDVLRRLLAKS